MDTEQAIRSRRNVRRYEERAIDEADLEFILEAGWRSPSASNRQPWDFILVTERDRLVALAKVWQGAGHVASSAATIVLVTPVEHEERMATMNQYDLGQATMAMMLAAADRGIGSGHAAIGDQKLARELLGVPQDQLCAYLIAFGYPADRPLRPIRNPNRRPLSEVVHLDRF